ncbi:sugar transferase [Rhizobium sp. CNPSo 4039]|jgi:exopolysaccharide production protein ExoY|uniref:sugar transferase n=1 Tax=Rhizobium sp. CNPSo 4039 TaxID=3021409 RepID=UPI00254A7EE5|nr:sugar transferase [Rhizobium sp. CNPSo 4039]MDK4716429.1 sugar transferase [Rhizobium sp. CNPSo 4039]
MLSTFDSIAHRERARREAKRTERRGRVKRIVDLVLSGLGLLFLAPALLVIAIALLLVDGRPVIYRHTRIGRDGRPFDCLKFRTMRKDADRQLAELLSRDEARKQEWLSTQKLTNDPRVHWLGKYLRMSSADELPQLVNVQRGDMSMVGPRPIVAAELDRYGANLYCYLGLRPGITGLWQVNRRADTTYEERIQFDLDYFHSRSLRTDFAILVKTVGVVLLARNEKERLTK